MTDLTNKAYAYMIKSHQDQVRWDGRPYKVHPEKVVSILTMLFDLDPCDDEELIASGYLHDVLEDVKGETYKNLHDKFGSKVASLVLELTNPPKLTDDEYVEHASKLSIDATYIKIADILANLTDNPTELSQHFMQKRLRALKALLINLQIG